MARTRRDRTTWVKLIEEWDGSGDSAEEFAAGRDMNPSTLKWWKSTGLPRGRRSKTTMARGKPEPRLVPVTVRATAVEAELVPTPAWVEAVVPETGVRLRFSVGTDTGYVAELLVAVRCGAC